MGMTIDKAYEILSNGLINAPSEYKWCTAFIMAIETMRKYQQIEEIYKNWCYPTHINAVEAMNKLGEVLKDGKV